jgi:CheY-like chemotaxis protein
MGDTVLPVSRHTPTPPERLFRSPALTPPILIRFTLGSCYGSHKAANGARDAQPYIWAKMRWRLCPKSGVLPTKSHKRKSPKASAIALAEVLGVLDQTFQSNPNRTHGSEVFPTPSPSAGLIEEVPGGHEIILLVEDEDIIRILTRTILEAYGYKVLEACNGHEGLSVCEANEGPIDLLLSDIVMPGLSGRELADRAMELRPGMKLLLMSGYAPDVILKEGIHQSTAFLPKPFNPAELARKVRDTLDSDKRPRGVAAVANGVEKDTNSKQAGMD